MEQKSVSLQSKTSTETPFSSEEEDAVFNESELLQRTLNDRECAKEVVTVFMKNMPQHMERLQSLCNQNKTNEIISLAHLIKGSAANVAAHSLRAIAYEIEKTAKLDLKENSETILNLIRLLEQEFKKLQDIIVKKYA